MTNVYLLLEQERCPKHELHIQYYFPYIFLIICDLTLFHQSVYNQIVEYLLNEKIANALINKLPSKIINKYNLCIKETAVEAGSGSLPLEKLPSIAIVVKSGMKMNDLSKKFRMASIPILGYIKENQFHIDLKSIPDYQEELLLQSIREVLK